MVLVLAAALTSGCSGLVRPDASAKDWMTALGQKNAAKLKELTCEANHRALETGLGNLQFLGPLATQFDRENRPVINVDELKYDTTASTADLARVHVTGRMRVTTVSGPSNQEVNFTLPLRWDGAKWQACNS